MVAVFSLGGYCGLSTSISAPVFSANRKELPPPMMTPYRNLKYAIAAIALLLSISIGDAPCKAEDNWAEAASQFAKDVLKEEYKKTAPPSAAPVFRWDFSKANVVHAYEFTQEMRSSTSTSLVADSNSLVEEGMVKGIILVKGQGDSTAELVLKDVKMQIKAVIGASDPVIVEQQMPVSVLAGMKEDGSGPFENYYQDNLVKMPRLLFPLPFKALNIGESLDVPAQIPFNANGTMLPVKGNSRVTLVQYVDIGGRTCAQFNVDSDISNLKVPADLEGDYKCETKVISVFYFDVASRSLVSGTVAILMQSSIVAPMTQIDKPGKDASGTPHRAQWSMRSGNLIRVKLKE